MSKQARTLAYLICPRDLTVQRVHIATYHDIYTWIDATTFECPRFSDNMDGVFVDEEGLLKRQPPDNFFLVRGYPQVLAGKGLVMGCDAQGESIAPRTPWETFKSEEFVTGVTVNVLPTGKYMNLLSPMEYIDEILGLPEE